MARPRRRSSYGRTESRSWNVRPIVLPKREYYPPRLSPARKVFMTTRNLMRSDVPFKGRLTFKRQRKNVFDAMMSHVPFRKDVICAKRKIRKEVLHALGFNQRGMGAGRPKRHSPSSKIKC